MRKVCLLFCLVGAACNVNLEPKSSAIIGCDGDGDCPKTYSCSRGLHVCVKQSSNQPPVVSVGTVPQSLGVVHVPLVLFDADSDAVQFNVELSQDGGEFQPIDVQISVTQGAPDGVAAEITWDAGAFFGNTNRHINLRVRLTPRDAHDLGASVTSEPFTFGNDPPGVAPLLIVTDAKGVASGNVQLRFVATDSDSDPVSVTTFAVDGAAVTIDAVSFPSTPLTDLQASPSGVEHILTWNSSIAAAIRRDGVVVTIGLTDHLGGVSMVEAFLPVRIDNAPVVTIDPLHVTSGVRFVNAVSATYHVLDPSGGTANVAFEYSLDGSTWQSATSTSNVAADGSAQLLTWDVLSGSAPLPSVSTTTDVGTQATAAYVPQVLLRAMATNTHALTGDPSASTDAFALGDGMPAASLLPFAGPRNGEVPVAFYVSDDSADGADCELQFRMSGDPGPTGWREAKIKLGGLDGLSTLASPPGREHVVTWDSIVDQNADHTQAQGIGRTGQTNVELRARCSAVIDGHTRRYGDWSASSVISSLANETAPRVVDVTLGRTAYSIGSGPVAIQYRLADTESDLVDLRVECSFDNGAHFHDCIELVSPLSEGTYNLTSAPTTFVSDGVLHTFIWDATRQLFTPQVVTLRFTASDGQMSSTFQTTLPFAAGPAGVAPYTPVYRLSHRESLTWPHGAHIVDYNNDTYADVIVAEAYTGIGGYIFIYTNNTDGTFTMAQFLADGFFSGGPQAVTTGDFTGDGVLDIAAPFTSDNAIVVFSGNGSGFNGPSAMAATGPSGGYNPEVLAAVDLDHDGRDDVVSFNSVDISVFIATGSGQAVSFAPPVIYGQSGNFSRSAYNPTVAAAGDVDGDGDKDIIVAATDSDRLQLVINDGDGTISLGASYTGLFGLSDPEVRDVNRDGIADIISGPWLLLGLGAGAYLAPQARAATSSAAVATTDITGDGVDEMISAVANADGLTFYALNPATRGYDLLGTFPIDPNQIGGELHVRSADFDHDGAPDFVLTSAGFVVGFGGYISFVLGNGAKGLGAAAISSQTRQMPFLDSPQLQLVDADGNGLVDSVQSGMIIYNEGVGGIGAGAFSTTGTPEANVEGGPTAYYTPTAVADFNGDGLGDLVSAATGGAGSYVLTVGLGTPSRVFNTVTSLVGGPPAGLACGDFNRDGKLDMVVGGRTTSSLTTYLGNGDGTFTTQASSAGLAGQTNPRYMPVADFNRDGQLDLLIFTAPVPTGGGGEEGGGSTESVSVYLGNGDGTFVQHGGWQSVSVHQYQRATIADVNDDGKVDVVIKNNNVELWSGDGAGGFTRGTMVGAAYGRAALLDADGDGVLDVAYSDNLAPRLIAGGSTGGLSTGLFSSAPLTLPIGAQQDFAAADLDGDLVPDLVAGPAWVAGQVDGISSTTQALVPFTPSQAGVSLYGPSGALSAVGVDRLGVSLRHPTVSQALARVDVMGQVDFRNTLATLPLPTGEVRVPLTRAWNVLGDVTLKRVTDPLVAPAGEPRLQVQRPYALDLQASPQRGIVFELPILPYAATGAIDTSKVRVYGVSLDWLRADQAPYDAAYGQPAASSYLPIALTPGSSLVFRDVIAPKPRAINALLAPDAAFATGSGPRFIVVTRGNSSYVRVLTDALGTYQAFLLP